MDYLDFYGLRREPFSNVPDQRFFWNGRSHQVALTKLQFALSQRRGLALVTGEIGAGKTTLARCLFESLDDTKFHKALLVVIHAEVTADWLLHRFAQLLGIRKPQGRKLEVIGQIYQRLREIDQEGKIVAMLIDEAQMLGTRELMEEFRGLLNIEAQNRKLINFVFFGLPEVEHNLRLDEPLRNRVALRIGLERYGAEDTMHYIVHRVTIAEGPDDLIPAEACARIHHFSQGSPRITNALCDNLLLEGYLNQSRTLTGDMVDKIAAELNVEPAAPDPLAEILGRPATAAVPRQMEYWQEADLDEILDFLDE
jgi:general secretion pathway protein A